jgi:DNA polymerase-3 subunit delta
LPRVSDEPLRPVYLLSGTDRPKVRRALARLRARFGDESVETLAADVATADEATAACNALGLFSGDGGRLVIVEGVERWKADDAKAIARYLADPVPGAVLALVAEEPPRSAALADACAKAGQVLVFDVPKPKDPSVWVRAEFERLGTPADQDAARALVEIAGDDVTSLANEIEKIATWAGGASVGAHEVHQLAVPLRESDNFALVDAWGRRDLAGVLRVCETELERGVDPFLLAIRLAGHVVRVRSVQALLDEGLPVREIASRLGMKEFPARKCSDQSRNYTREELDAAVVRLAALDAALKGASRLAAELELERALVEITRAAESAARA